MFGKRFKETYECIYFIDGEMLKTTEFQRLSQGELTSMHQFDLYTLKNHQFLLQTHCTAFGENSWLYYGLLSSFIRDNLLKERMTKQQKL